MLCVPSGMRCICYFFAKYLHFKHVHLYDIHLHSVILMFNITAQFMNIVIKVLFGSVNIGTSKQKANGTYTITSSQAKGTKSTLFLANEVDLVPLACKDDTMITCTHFDELYI